MKHTYINDACASQFDIGVAGTCIYRSRQTSTVGGNGAENLPLKCNYPAFKRKQTLVGAWKIVLNYSACGNIYVT